MKGPTFLMYPGTCTYFSFRDFSRLLVLFVFNEYTAIFVYLPTINGYKNQRAVYEWVIISDDLVYEWVRFFRGQVYDWIRCRNTGSNTRTTITPKFTPPPPPHPHEGEYLLPGTFEMNIMKVIEFICYLLLFLLSLLL